MLEFIFFILFVGAFLLITGVTIITVLVASGIAFLLSCLFSLVGIVFKVIPWIIAIVVIVYLYRTYAPRS